MNRSLKIGLVVLAMLCIANRASAQHTIGMTGGYGYSTFRPYPAQTIQSLWGNKTFGLSWRYYGPQRFAGGFGIDVEYLERGFRYAPYQSEPFYQDTPEDDPRFLWYTRRVKSIVVPIVWQPHVYLAKNRLRLYLDLSAFVSFNLSATYDNGYALQMLASDPYFANKYFDFPQSGTYHFKEGRDNRWGYGLAGGGGIAILTGRWEWSLRVRYYFGYSDMMKNRNKYPNYFSDVNSDRPYENPFSQSPLRSPVDNLMFNFGVAFRLSKGGFKEWDVRPLRSRKMNEEFQFYQ